MLYATIISRIRFLRGSRECAHEWRHQSHWKQYSVSHTHTPEIPSIQRLPFNLANWILTRTVYGSMLFCSLFLLLSRLNLFARIAFDWHLCITNTVGPPKKKWNKPAKRCNGRGLNWKWEIRNERKIKRPEHCASITVSAFCLCFWSTVLWLKNIIKMKSWKFIALSE